MDRWQWGIFHRKSSLIEHGVICGLLITPSVSLQSTAIHAFEWNEVVCFAFAREMKGCRFRCNALWFVKEGEGRGAEEGAGALYFLLLRVSHPRSLRWLTPILSGVWGVGAWEGGWRGVQPGPWQALTTAYRVSSELLSTLVNAEERSDLLLPSVPPAPSQDRILPQGWWGQIWVLRCHCTGPFEKKSYTTIR